MDIKTKDDWIKLAEQTIPELANYAAHFASSRGSFDEAKATALLESVKAGGKGFTRLADMFEALWTALPDSGSIRFAPFFDLCYLCSERWVGEN